MAEYKILTDLNLNGNQLKSAVVESLYEAPQNPKPGQIYFNLTDNTFYCYGSDGWKKGEVYTASNPAEGTTGAIGVYFGTDNNNFKFRMLKANDQYLTIAEGAEEGIIIFGVNVANLPVQPSVVTKFEDYYTKGETEALVSGVFRIRGVVDYYDELPKSAHDGDVWLVRYKTPTSIKPIIDGPIDKPSQDPQLDSDIIGRGEPWGAEFVWIDREWELLGYEIDLSAYEILNADTTPSEGIQLSVDANGTLHIDAAGAKANWEAYGNSMLKAAKDYADALLIEAKDYSDSNLRAAKDYTDSEISNEVTRSNEYSNNNLNRAKQYSDEKLQDAKDYADAVGTNVSTDSKRYTDNSITNVKQWARERMPEVEAGDESITVETQTSNEKNTYKVKVADSIQEKITEVEHRATAKYYSVTISKNTENNNYVCLASQHQCGEKVMAQILMDNAVVEVGLDISNNGNIRVYWNGTLPSNLLLIVIGLTDNN